MEDLVQKVRTLISRNQIKQAFRELKQNEHKFTQDQRDSLALIEGSYTESERNLNNFVITHEEAGRNRARVMSSMLKLLNELLEEAPTQSNPEAFPEFGGEGADSSGAATILFLAANPSDTGRLRLDKEHREISEGLKRSAQRDKFDLVPHFALRAKDLSRAMLEQVPTYVHFSGHGVRMEQVDTPVEADTRFLDWGEDEDPAYLGGLALEGSNGQTHIVKAEALGALFSLYSGQIACVMLNACYSELQAEALIPHVGYVVGMNAAVPDRTAIVFATAFYDAIGAGKPIDFAFKAAKAQLLLEDLPGADIPVIIKGQGGQA